MAADEVIEQLEQRCGQKWPYISAARQRTRDKLQIVGDLEDLHADNTSLVVFGSFARYELTQGSDADWCLLIDGPSDPEHYQLIREIGEKLREHGFSAPGTTGTFASPVSSHELIHHIGGIQDTNQNLTRRLLLLLESLAIGDRVAYDRVMRAILQRYLVFDTSVERKLRQEHTFVPRFLLNDIVRLWRTMAVDYAAKQWEQADGKWALRNAKLRMSRKLLFTSGLLLCFSFELEPPDVPRMSTDMLPEFFAAQLKRTPLERMAASLLEHGSPEAGQDIFGSCDQFLAVLNDPEKREHLESLSPERAEKDELFQQIRALSKRLQAGLTRLFFEDDQKLYDLVQRYGVF